VVPNQFLLAVNQEKLNKECKLFFCLCYEFMHEVANIIEPTAFIKTLSFYEHKYHHHIKQKLDLVDRILFTT